LVERRTGSQNDDFESCSMQVSIDPVFFERVEREVRRFEYRRFVRAGESSRELLGSVSSSAEEDEFLPASKFSGDSLNDGGGR